MTSLRTQLWISLLGLFTGAGSLAGAVSYWIARDEAKATFDNQMRQIAANIIDISGGASNKLPADPSSNDPEDDFVVQVWDGRGSPLLRTSKEDIPPKSITGFSLTRTASETWRTYTLVMPDRTVQISQQNVVREEFAGDAALRSLVPIATLMPLTWLLLRLGIERVLRRLDRLTQSVARRAPDERLPISTKNVPGEVIPLVEAVNSLLARLHLALSAHKRFVSDAAHELRTPIAALQLQIDNLRQVAHGELLVSRIDDLESGLRRASRLTGQLLKMARQDADGVRVDSATVDLVDIARASIAEVLPIVDRRRQDVGLVRDDPATVEGDAAALRILIGNLLENAVRYTPEGGTVDVGVVKLADEVAVEIVDTGSGIPDKLLERVFDPFYRAAGGDTDGSGLGLAIAARIAAQHGATIELRNRSDRPGLTARVTFASRKGAQTS